MADIDKELNDIKNAVYGREVRSSIHDGIKKINEESEESKQKADDAYEITQDLLDETFDSAALEANFEQRLDNEIANLQPEWTQFKDDTVAQLAEKAQRNTVNDIRDGLNTKSDKEYVDNKLSEKVSRNENGSISWGMLRQDVRENISGGNTAVVGVDSVNTDNIVDGAVTITKLDKSIRDVIRCTSVALPLSHFKYRSTSYTTPINKDIYKAIKFNTDPKVTLEDTKIVTDGIEATTVFSIEYFITEEMKVWGSVSASIEIDIQNGDDDSRVEFYRKDGSLSKRVLLEKQGSKLVAESVTIPHDATYFSFNARTAGTSNNVTYKNHILTMGDIAGTYSESYYKSVFQNPREKMKIGGLFWRQGSLAAGRNYEQAKNSTSPARITVKKDYAIKNDNYKYIYWLLPDDYKLSIVQYDINGEEVSNSDFIKPVMTSKSAYQGNSFSGKYPIENDAKHIFVILAYVDDKDISPNDLMLEPIYIGTNDLNELNGQLYTKIIKDSVAIESDETTNITCPIHQPSYLYKYIAHGGLEEYAPSMTIEAYELSALFGMWGIESDVQLTKDEEIIMMHDDTVDRTTNGTGKVANLTLAEIKQLKITQKSNLYDYDLRVPTIDEYLKVCKKHQMVAIIEIKDQPNLEKLCEKLIRKLERYNMIENTIIISFGWEQLDAVREAHQDVWVAQIYRGVVTQTYLNKRKRYGNFALFNYNGDLVLDDSQMDLLRKNNVPVLHGVANTKSQLDYAMNLGVDAILTDNFYDANRPTVKYNAFIETNDNGSSWTYQSINNMVDVNFDTTNDDLRFMFEQVPRNWLKQLQGRVEVEYLGTDDVIVKAFYDDDIKQIRCKFYENGIIKNVGNIPNGKFNVTILL